MINDYNYPEDCGHRVCDTCNYKGLCPLAKIYSLIEEEPEYLCSIMDSPETVADMKHICRVCLKSPQAVMLASKAQSEVDNLMKFAFMYGYYKGKHYVPVPDIIKQIDEGDE